ncbi:MULTISPECIES: ribose 5-phosphate isomerase A [Metallosphaera]|uniref:Ribose 5-phosphate isomerase A n=3 Tax=Metallosphaera TaxID=41980 RepID=A4YJ22_METS5|nr:MULTISPECIES: ribose 5-phosphate isomerase A [Metallosphaera]ABP96424.1 ribose-5-phosphate isomerase [Metallosphaera sedula DSM 5348]AIM28407.1 ribose-5-phosphate isomerase [Metallosphaera sedula]AKV75189.1 ribose 5-phosphate isomerase [Metallosphaera sedula]AKV77425.1 ribose 5-phosphate isomerase [Metallosphaera sedula]AKV79677.1 ribose 5-phosphate isomerase [Metallosphaera sedula]
MTDPKEVLAHYILPILANKRVIGLGTGKTVRKLVEVMALQGSLQGRILVTSSTDTDLLASSKGALVLSPFSGVIPEIYVDGFDFLVESQGRKVLIKGGGAALLREKILSFFSKERIFIGETSKFVSRREIQVPVEVVPAGFSLILVRLNEMGLKPVPREGSGKMGPVVTDNGNLILDISVMVEDLCKWERELKTIPGVVETGIFCENLYDSIVIGDSEGRIQVFQRG